MRKLLDKSKLRRLYDACEPDFMIARIVGADPSTIAHWRHKHGLPANSRAMKVAVIDENHFQCRSCHKIKAKELFTKTSNVPKGEQYGSKCLECIMKRAQALLSRDIKTFLKARLRRLRTVSRRDDLLFTITLEDLLHQYNAQGGKCFYTDVELVWGYGQGTKPNTLSVDRVLSTNGYVRGNVVFCANQINMVKNNLTLDQLKKWIPDWHNRISTFLIDQSSVVQSGAS